MTAAAAGAILLSLESYVRALGPRRAEHGGWHLYGQGHADYGARLRQAILCCTADLAWQCRREPFRRWLAGVDSGHGPTSRAQKAHREWPVAAGAGQGSFLSVRRGLAQCAVCLSSARVIERRRLSRAMDRRSEHPDP